MLESVNAFLWNAPLPILLAGTHLLLTFRFFPQRHLFQAIAFSMKPDQEKNAKGLSCFATLSTTLAATLGTGNIVGVSTAIALGGPGALFWCFLTGVFGMATAYLECYLSLLYRTRDENGHSQGGPMYVLEKGLGFRRLAKAYALFVSIAALGAGCTTQSSAMADAAFSTFHVSPHIIGAFAACLCGFVILGGVNSIGHFCTRLVPPLSILYILSCVILIWMNGDFLLPSLGLIVTSAFTPKAATGGFVGSTFLLAARFGIARGLFTNEAGIGTAAITAGASGCMSVKNQALVSMTAVFWDTIVMCTVTGLTIVSCMLAHPGCTQGFSEAGLTSAAFSFLQLPFFPKFGQVLLTLSLIAFAIATLVGWCYLGEMGIHYLFGPLAAPSYRLIYIVMIYAGAILPMNLIWSFTDLINACMVIPNLICIWLLFRKI